MLYFDGAVGVVLFLFWVCCIIDVVTTPGERCRNLPKVAWVIIVLLFPAVGSIAWLLAGRPRADGVDRRIVPAPGFPEYERLGRAAAEDPDSDAEFLAQCRARAEEQRMRYQQQRRRDEA